MKKSAKALSFILDPKILEHFRRQEEAIRGYVGGCMVRIQGIHRWVVSRKVTSTDPAAPYAPTPIDVTAFCIELPTGWYLVSALHVWNNVFKPVEPPGRECFKLQLLVGFGTGTTPSPVSIPEHEELALLNSGEDVDIAVFPIPPLLVPQLAKQGLRPLRAEVLQPGDIGADILGVLGFPRALDKPAVYLTHLDGGEIKTSNALVMLPTETTTARDRAELLRSDNQLLMTMLATHYATPDGDLPISTANGFSGGPIFAFEFYDGAVRIKLVGVQVSEFKDRDRHILRGSLTESILAQIPEFVLQLIERLKASNDENGVGGAIPPAREADR